MSRAPNPELLSRPEKKCPICERVKPRKAFYRNTNSSDGLSGYCKECTKKKVVEWQRANPEKKAKQDHRRWEEPERRENTLRLLEEWRTKNPEKVRKSVIERSGRYRGRHPERVKETQRRYRENLSDVQKEARRALQRSDSYRWQRALYRSEQRHGTPLERRIPLEEWMQVVDRFHGRCAYCKQESNRMSIDHFVPRIRGGKHEIGNVVPACLSCNVRKINLAPDDFCQLYGYDYVSILKKL